MMDTKPMLEKRIAIVRNNAWQRLRDSGLTDADIDSAAHGRMDAIEVADQYDTPTLDYMLVSLVMDCRQIEKEIQRGVSDVAGNVKAAETELHRLSMQPNAVAGWKSKTGGTSGGNKPKRRKWAEWACKNAAHWDDLPTSSTPWEYNLKEMEALEIYRDGGNLIAFDPDTGKEHKLARSTVEKRYLKHPGQ